jgi:hypothetical protein
LHLRRGARLLAATAVLAALGGCSAGDSEPAGLATEATDPLAPSTEATTAPTGPTEGTSGPQPTTPTDLPAGLVFEDVPAATGVAAAALQAYLGLETEGWRGFLAAELSPDLATFATPAVVAEREATAKYQRDHELEGGGSMVITPSIGRVGEHVVQISACADVSGVTNVVDGEETPAEEIRQSPTWVIEALVMPDQEAGIWKVSEYRVEPKKC